MLKDFKAFNYAHWFDVLPHEIQGRKKSQLDSKTCIWIVYKKSLFQCFCVEICISQAIFFS